MVTHVDLFCVLWYLIKSILYLELGLFAIKEYKRRVINERVLGGVDGGRWGKVVEDGRERIEKGSRRGGEEGEKAE